jgi:hypothetical protein
MEAVQIAPQFLKMVAGWHPEVPISRRIVDHLDFTEQTAFQVGRDLLRSNILHEEIAQPVIPKAHDHSATPTWVTVPPYGTFCKPHQNGQERHSLPRRQLHVDPASAANPAVEPSAFVDRTPLVFVPRHIVPQT